MSSVLIDTQAMIWIVEDNPNLSERGLALADNRTTQRLFSVASIWEMAIKIAIGKLDLKHGTLDEFLSIIKDNEVELLQVQALEAVDVALLSQGDHKDPFDRLIAAQCLRYDLTLVSIDSEFDQYGVRRVW
ncbi:type II toxin-antitoxin system VapC family toxin [Bythopirellula goksoeyrii]|uniref:PIN domain protein n=1 Tax=Bythopirellula goksoeyrii TaxID=1400387 RepID=A0A5B9QTL5_9BACT|nr:type II toxin-antitoxin system VapC family toxin [Bythopirellula goksoeyrii]QEG37263.1 PIN domain protein [Bythopirellula goksoeyrii]